MPVGEFITKEYGQRPPVDPPSRTGFGSDGDDSLLEWYKEQVREIKSRIFQCDDFEEGQVLARMLNQRIEWIKKDMMCFEMFHPIELPPFDFFLEGNTDWEIPPAKPYSTIMWDFVDLSNKLDRKMYGLDQFGA